MYSSFELFKRQPHKMVKHSQTIRRLSVRLTVLWGWRLKV